MTYEELISKLSVLRLYPATNGGGGGGGTVTSVNTGAGLTGGPITNSGTVELAPVANNTLLANVSGGSLAPSEFNISDLFFDAAAAVYFGPGGDNTNGDGTREKPYETLARAITRFNELVDGGVLFVQVIGLGTGIDASNVTVDRSGLDLYAPGIQLNPVAGDGITVDLAGWGSATYINVVLASSTVASGDKAVNLIGITGGNNSVTRFTYYGRAQGDVYLANKCEFYATIVTGLLTAVESGTNVITQYGIGAISQESRLNLEGITFGAGGGSIHGPVNFTNKARYPMRNVIFLTGDRTLDYTLSGYLIVNDTTSAYTITLPDTTGQGTPAFVLGYEATFLNLSTGSISFVADGAASLIGATILDQVAQRANCTLYKANTWEVDQVVTSGGSSNPTAVTISPTVFTYFNQITTGSTLWLSSTAPNTQGAFSGSAAADYGTFTFKAAAGTYNCAILFPQGTGNGIMRLIFNGGTPTDIDEYGTNINQYVSYQFSVTLVEGDNTIQCLTNGKNGSSTNYFLTFADNIVLNRTGP